jgi:hypothetical protein
MISIGFLICDRITGDIELGINDHFTARPGMVGVGDFHINADFAITHPQFLSSIREKHCAKSTHPVQ